MFFKNRLAIGLSTTIVVLSLALGAVDAKSPPDWNKELAKGNQQLSIGNKDEAVKIFSQKCEKYPQSGACHTALGRALKRLGKQDDAKREFRTATQVEPSYADGFYEYGSTLESDQQWADAIAAFQTYLTLSPDASKRKNIEDRIRFCQDKIQ